MTTSYIDERLNIGIIYETIGSPVGWDTTIISRDNGFYLPIERQFDSIGRWNIGDRRYSKKEFDYLLNFFYNVRGNAIAFRYKDWGDYKATGQAIANGDGTTTLFQLIKTYGDYYKDIRRPVADTVKIYLNGVLQTSGFTIYYSVGVIQFAEPPASGVAISADFEFDLVVRFENENLSSRFDAYDASHPEEALYDVPAIFLIEVLPAIASSNSGSDYRWACSGGSCYPTDDNTAPYPTQSACEAALLSYGAGEKIPLDSIPDGYVLQVLRNDYVWIDWGDNPLPVFCADWYPSDPNPACPVPPLTFWRDMRFYSATTAPDVLPVPKRCP